MRTVDRDLDRIVTLLRRLIRQRGFTQLEVQEDLGWGRSYISQLVNKQKSLRVEHVLMILKVIGVTPEDFFGEIYQFGDAYGSAGGAGRAARSQDRGGSMLRADLDRSMGLLDGLISLLEQKKLIAASELSRAVERVRRER